MLARLISFPRPFFDLIASTMNSHKCLEWEYSMETRVHIYEFFISNTQHSIKTLYILYNHVQPKTPWNVPWGRACLFLLDESKLLAILLEKLRDKVVEVVAKKCDKIDFDELLSSILIFPNLSLKNDRETMERIKSAFEYADKAGKGALSKHQYKIAMTVLFGFTPDKFETRQIFQGDSKSWISFEEFLTWVLKKGYRDEIDAQTLFVLLDKDFKGHVNIWDFYSATEFTDLRVSRSIWRKVFQQMDQRKEGFLGLEDLTLVMNVERG